MKKEKSIAKNTIMNMFLTASQFIFPLISFPYISRVLGAVGNGKVAFATSVISYFVMFASLGIPTYGIRLCAKCRDDKEKLSKSVHELLIINAVTTVIAYIVLSILLHIVPQFKAEKTLFMVMSLSIFLNALGMEWLYKAIEEYTYITIRSVLSKVLAILLMFLFVRSSNDYIIYALLSILSSTGSYVLNIFGARRIIEFKYYGNYNIKQHLKPIFTLFAASVAISIYANMDAVMIGFMHGDYQNGLYSVSVRIKQILLSITASLTTVLIPRMSYCIEKNDKVSIRMFIDKGLRFSAILAFPVAFFCAFNAKDCMVFIAGEEYADAQYAFFFQSICVLIGSFSSVFSNQILIPYGKDTDNFKSMCVGTAVNLLLNVIWIKPFGAAGAAAATLVTECAVCGCLYRNCKKILFNEIKFKVLLQYAVPCSMAFFLMTMTTIFVKIGNLFLRLLFKGCLSFSLYFLILFLVKEPLMKEVYQKSLQYIKKNQ